MKNEDRINRRRAIWKFQLTAMDVPMPFDAEVCTFQYQNGVPCIWAIVDPDVMNITRRFRIFGTGHELPAIDQCCYVGTAQDGYGEPGWAACIQIRLDAASRDANA